MWGLALVAIMVGLGRLAGPAAALLMRAATILLSVALVAGAIAFAAFGIWVAPSLRSRRAG